jgi:hypothetical protein
VMMIGMMFVMHRNGRNQNREERHDCHTEVK